LKSLKNWFDPIVVRHKRNEIATLISRLAKDFHKDAALKLPDIAFDHQSRKCIWTDENKFTVNSKSQLKVESNQSKLKNIDVKSFYNFKINHSSSKVNKESSSMIRSNQSLTANSENSFNEIKKYKSPFVSPPLRISGTSAGTNNLIKSTSKFNKKNNIKDWLHSNRIKKTSTSSSNSFYSLSFEALQNVSNSLLHNSLHLQIRLTVLLSLQTDMWHEEKRQLHVINAAVSI
jgi:hypothetical protein